MNERRDDEKPKTAANGWIVAGLLAVIATTFGFAIWTAWLRDFLARLPARVEEPPIIAGDPAAGQRLFFDPRIGCAQCHRRGGQGGAAGPDLSTTKTRYNRRNLEQAILTPRTRVAQSFVEATIACLDGAVHVGLMPRDNADPIRLVQRNGEIVVLKRADIEAIRESNSPSMPTNFPDLLTVRQLADLCAYLLGDP